MTHDCFCSLTDTRIGTLEMLCPMIFYHRKGKAVYIKYLILTDTELMVLTPKFSVNFVIVGFSFGTLLLWVFGNHLCPYVLFTFVFWVAGLPFWWNGDSCKLLLLFLANKRLGPDRVRDSPVRLCVLEIQRWWKEDHSPRSWTLDPWVWGIRWMAAL